jgi:6-phosphogluconolactonase
VTKLGEMLVAADGDSLARIAARLTAGWIAEALNESKDGIARIAFSGGSTPRVMMRHLTELAIPWGKVEIFWVDDRAVPADSPRSNFGAAKEDLLSKLSVPPLGVHPFRGDAADLDVAASEHETLLSWKLGAPKGGEPPRFDVMWLGIGDDGHTASLFPGDPFVHVTDRWVVHVPAAPGREARLTLTKPVITAAKRLALLAQGASKKGPLTRARERGSLDETPARLVLDARGDLVWLIDEAARP